jgi:hypothetical protein
MSKDPKQIKDYADGWITEREGTDVPAFLKFATVVISLGAASYLIFYMNGEINHADRGPLVRLFNQVTGNGDTVMYLVAALALIYAVIVSAFAFAKHKD